MKHESLSLMHNYPKRIFLFFLVALLCMIVGAIAVGAILMGGQTAVAMRIGTVVQDVVMFIMPAVVTAMLVSRTPARLLEVDRMMSPDSLVLAIAALVASIPAMNALVEWNQSLTLPAALSGVETWMRNAEMQAQGAVEVLLGGTSYGDLIVGLLIVAVLAGFSEEIFFRGALQRLIMSGPLNHHLAIWLTAFIFSAFHMQFFGFFPRLVLGGYFGYLLYWSRSLWLPVIIHALNNGLVVYFSWKERGVDGEVASSFDGFGVDSLWLILVSVVLTAATVVLLKSRVVRSCE